MCTFTYTQTQWEGVKVERKEVKVVGRSVLGLEEELHLYLKIYTIGKSLLNLKGSYLGLKENLYLYLKIYTM